MHSFFSKLSSMQCKFSMTSSRIFVTVLHKILKFYEKYIYITSGNDVQYNYIFLCNIHFCILYYKTVYVLHIREKCHYPLFYIFS